ncbi:MAG: hypothetical protein AAB960_01055 [Patescibacteria group bacterium]
MPSLSKERRSSLTPNLEHFQNFSIDPLNGKYGDFAKRTIAIYVINPGPALSIIPLSERLADRGAQVILKLAEPALSSALYYFKNRIHPIGWGAEQLTDILTCGHINVDTVTRDMLKIKNRNPRARIITIDDNFDMTVPIIRKLISLQIPPALSFIMNPLTKQTIEEEFQRQGATQSRVCVTNNPAFERFYNDMNQNPSDRTLFRKVVGIPENKTVIAYVGFPEGDYPKEYHDFVFESLRRSLNHVPDKSAIIYWPHGRGLDRLPKQLTNLPDHIQAIFHPRSWWKNRNIGLHKQLIGSDIALMTNSTTSVEAFTAWGKRRFPVAVPIDITLLDDFPRLRINESLRAQHLIPYIESRDQLIHTLPKIIKSSRDWEPINPEQRLHDLGWNNSPGEQIVSELLNI